MAIEWQKQEYQNLASQAEAENSQMDQALKNVIKEINELSDTTSLNDSINFNQILSANVLNKFNKIPETQRNAINGEINRLKAQYANDPGISKQLNTLSILFEAPTSNTATWAASFDTFNRLVRLQATNRLRDNITNSERRDIKQFIDDQNNKDIVLDTYLSMLPIIPRENMAESTSWRDRSVINDVKDRIEWKYNEQTRQERELNNKVFKGYDTFANFIKSNENWDWKTPITDVANYINTNYPYHTFTPEQFIWIFNEKNNERRTTLTNNLNEIVNWLDYTNIKKKWETTLVIEGTEYTSDNADLLTKLNITNIFPEWIPHTTAELAAAPWELFNKIIAKAEAITEAPEAETPAIDKISTEDINKTKMRWKIRVKPEDVVTAINNAIDSIANLTDDSQKSTMTEKINTVINNLKEPWTIEQGWGQTNIRELQKTMKAAGQNVMIDWKFGPNTFNAMNNYLKVWSSEQADPTEPNDPNTASNDPGETQNGVENPIKNSLTELQSELENKNFQGKQRVIDNIIGKTWSERENSVRQLQLHLLPKYKWKIDWKFWPNTLKALQDYMSDPKFSIQDTSEPNNEKIWHLLTPNDINMLDSNCVSIYTWAESFTAYFLDWTEITYKSNTEKHQMEFRINWDIYEFAWEHFYKNWEPSSDIPQFITAKKEELKKIYEKHKLIPKWWTKANYTRDADTLNQGTTVYKIAKISDIIDADKFPVHSCVEYKNIRFHKNNRIYSINDWKHWSRSKNDGIVKIKYDNSNEEQDVN